jgi:hypothetical protein
VTFFEDGRAYLVAINGAVFLCSSEDEALMFASLESQITGDVAVVFCLEDPDGLVELAMFERA